MTRYWTATTSWPRGEVNLTGRCTMSRNTTEMNGLFRELPLHRDLLSDPSNYGFDETATQEGLC